MVRLGLERIARLINNAELPWRAIHVAGTNGKGSICAHASALLHAASVPVGRFTSPHLIDRWDCITINEEPVSEDLFAETEDRVFWLDRKEEINASPFELLTATAFSIFTRQSVQVGVVEVGMGGRLDATNILTSPLSTVISKIGMDHQAFLGNTLVAIATEKAGIMKTGAPCIIDGTNSSDVLDVLRQKSVEAGVSTLQTIDEQFHLPETARSLPLHQQVNLACGIAAVESGLPCLGLNVDILKHVESLVKSGLPGRMQELSLEALTGRSELVLLDGAHNPQSAEVLALQTDAMRQEAGSLIWLVAASSGKDLRGIFSPLIKAGDHVVTTKFGPIDGMPWVTAASKDELRTSLPLGFSIEHVENVDDALQAASSKATGRPLVIAGSLYLVGQVLQRLRHARRAKR